MSKQINFVEKWLRGKPRNMTWSGTPYGIYTALEKNGVTINDIPLGESRGSAFLSKIHFIIMKLMKKEDFYLYEVKLGEKELKKKRLPAGVPNLFFTQYRFNGLCDTYFFQDYSVEFLNRLRKSGSQFMNFTPLREAVSDRDLQKRMKISEECANKCKGIFTMSKYLAREYIEKDHIPKHKVHWVGGGYNLDVSKIDGSNRTGRRFLYIGVSWETKNGPLIVEAYEKLRKSRDDIELWIAGPENEPIEIKGRNGITFLGRVPHSKVVDYYNQCDFFIMPSKADAYGLVFSEALVCGLPCIGKNILAMPEFIENDKNGYLLDNDDSEELKDLMEKMIINRERLCEYVKERHEFYKDYYSWDAVAKRMIEVFEKDGYFK